MRRIPKLGPKPTWIKEGMKVDYHSVIGGPVTQPGLTVRSEVQEIGGTWVVWLAGKSGCVAVSACTPAKEDGDTIVVAKIKGGTYRAGQVLEVGKDIEILSSDGNMVLDRVVLGSDRA